MIPQEKIEQAAVSLHKQMDYVQADLTLTIQDFTAGVRFAEEEMKQRALDFAEWCSLNGWELQGIGKWMNVMDFKIPADTRYTTAELYAKFEAEMNQQNNGG